MKAILQTIVIFIVGALIIVSVSWLVNIFRTPEVIEKEKIIEKILSGPECPRSFEAYKTLVGGGQSFQLLKDAPSYAFQGKFIKDYTITVNRTGEIACGYLYVRAKNDGRPLNEKYDSIYVNPHELGGHLIRPRSVPIPNPIPNTTEILLPLNAIPYLPTVPYDPNAQNYRIADWVKLLNVTNQIWFKIALSVQDPTGIIEEIRIAYKCWDPATGKETQNCQLGK